MVLTGITQRLRRFRAEEDPGPEEDGGDGGRDGRREDGGRRDETEHEAKGGRGRQGRNPPEPEADDRSRGQLDRYRRRLERERYYTQAIEPISSPTPPPSSSSSSSSSNMATTSAGNKLAQEIHDEFLTCKICLEGFKNPKCLDCLHTFCEQCIDNHVMSECTYKKYSDYREFTCPLCRKRTQLPIGGVKKLPDNFLVSSLGELLHRQKPSKYPFCDICKLVNRKHREATSKCLDCNKLLCKQCVDLHKDTKVTANHSLFDCEIEKDIECKEHPEEVVRFYCEPCQLCVCVLCTFNEHKDHEISQFIDAVSKYKESIQTLLDNCKEKIDVYDTQLALLTKCEGVIKAAEQRIKDAAIQFIAEVRTKEKNLIDELHGVYGTELMEYVSRKGEMQSNLDSLKSTCNLTELVLKGKDIELLLLKKQVQEKLSVLADKQLKDLPKTVGKQISFVAGNLEYGHLEDPDLPDFTKGKIEDSQNTKQTEEPKRTLTNMIFGKFEKDRGRGHVSEQEVPKRTIDTQTDAQGKPGDKSTSNQCVQTEFRESTAREPIYIRGESSSCGSSPGISNKCTETETVATVEKAVNTRSKSMQLPKTSSKDESPPPDSSSGLDAASSPVLRRQRRRRDRARAVEVSVRPTTYGGVASSDGYEGGFPVLTYSSSIEENRYNPGDEPSTVATISTNTASFIVFQPEPLS